MKSNSQVSWQPSSETTEVPVLRLVAAERRPIGVGLSLLLVALSAVLAIGVAWQTARWSRTARDLQRQIDDWERQGVREEVATLRNHLSAYRAVEQKLEGGPPLLEILRQLSLRLPLSVWLDEVRYDRAGGTLQVVGWAISRVAAEDMVARLRMATGLFHDVHLWEARPTTHQGQRVYRIRLQAELTRT